MPYRHTYYVAQPHLFPRLKKRHMAGDNPNDPDVAALLYAAYLSILGHDEPGFQDGASLITDPNGKSFVRVVVGSGTTRKRIVDLPCKDPRP